MAATDSSSGSERDPVVAVADSKFVAVAHGAGATANVTYYGTPPPIDYSAKMRDDVAYALSQLERRNVLFAQIDHEIWRHVFQSLRELRAALSDTSAHLRTRGPRDVKAVLQFMVRAVAKYLEKHEADYERYMSSHGGFEPGWAHVEREWLLATQGAAADDLLSLREALSQAIRNLSSYADTGETIEWKPTYMAKYWSEWVHSEMSRRSAAEADEGGATGPSDRRR
jgi:hypothetical protein